MNRKLYISFLIIINCLYTLTIMTHYRRWHYQSNQLKLKKPVKNNTYKSLACSCLEHIMDSQFRHNFNQLSNHTHLLTIIIDKKLVAPADDIQEQIVKRIHNISHRFQIEVASYGTREEFKSFVDCKRGSCQRRFVLNFKTKFYLIIMDDPEQITELILMLAELNTYNPLASFLIYIESNSTNYKEAANHVLNKMWDNYLVYTAVLVPQDLRIFNLYHMSTKSGISYNCVSQRKLVLMDQCSQGKMKKPSGKYFLTGLGNNFGNCSVGVIAKVYEPFVINRNTGFEIRTLKTIGETLNINFNVTISKNLSYFWGEKNGNGSWTGDLKTIFENMHLGIGNVDMGVDYGNEFIFTHYHHMETLVFVVPLAHLVPKWRIFTAILSLEMWGVCFGIIISSAFLLYYSSKISEKASNFMTLGYSCYSSLQIFMSQATSKQPSSDWTRVFYMSLSIFSIIIASIYTCALIYYIKNPIREYQDASVRDLWDKFGNLRYDVGGIKRFKSLFNKSTRLSKKIYEVYKTASKENDNIKYWLDKVGDDRNIWTISSQFYVNFLIATNDHVASDDSGKPKIYVFNKERMIIYPISMIARKGHPMIKKINKVIKRLLYAGLVSYYASEYIVDIGKGAAADTQEDNTLFEPLSTIHLQGAFALLVLGYGFGVLAYIIELIVDKIAYERMIRKLGYQP